MDKAGLAGEAKATREDDVTTDAGQRRADAAEAKAKPPMPVMGRVTDVVDEKWPSPGPPTPGADLATNASETAMPVDDRTADANDTRPPVADWATNASVHEASTPEHPEGRPGRQRRRRDRNETRASSANSQPVHQRRRGQRDRQRRRGDTMPLPTPPRRRASKPQPVTADTDEETGSVNGSPCYSTMYAFRP